MRLFRTLLFVTVFWSLLTLHSFGMDTDLYTGSASGVKPNIVILYDNSGSMIEEVDTGAYYNPGTTYPTHPDHTDVVATAVYNKPTSGYWFDPLDLYKDSISKVACPDARTVLSDKGLYTGPTNNTCDKTQKTLATGNYLNFFLGHAGIVETMPRREIAKTVITDFLRTIANVRMGLATFHPVKINEGAEDSDLEETEGGYIHTYLADIDESGKRETLITAVEAMAADDFFPWTTLAESLYEIGLYFQGKPSYFNSGVTYADKLPNQYYCQKNYVIIMTDGQSTKDRNAILGTIGDQDGDKREPPGAENDPGYSSLGSDYLDDVAKYLYDSDLCPTLQDKQNVVTYTIGFAFDPEDSHTTKAYDLLERTAAHGHGRFFISPSGATLADAFSTILNEILAKTSSFVAPIVPVSRMERTTAGDKIYLAFFKPASTGMWSGNIKKYGVAQSDDALKSIEVGDLVDVSGSKALDSRGEFYPTSKSYWTTTSSDGGEVEKGGVGQVLLKRSSARKIYTYLGTNSDLTHASNAFVEANSSLTYSLLEVTSDQRNPLIKFVHGYDAYDGNSNDITNEKRSWILGSFLHSRPYLIHYPDRSVIYAGANDGMLHAFDDESGEELWAFIPPDLLKRLKELPTDTPGIFVDGSPKAYVTYDEDGDLNKAILIFGLRRGGNYYYALDVTNPTGPKYLWKIYNGKGGYFQELGQTWSSPAIGWIPYGAGKKLVAIFGAGYDVGQDDELNPPDDDIGRGVYFADLEDGSMVRYVSHAGGQTNMTYSIPSDVTKLDMDGNGTIDRVYVGDMDARMWRIDITKDGVTGKIIFRSNRGASEKRKIFYPPDVTFENGYEMLFFGTGDREAPKSNKDKDRIYGFKDKNPGTSLDEDDLVNVSLTLLASGVTTENGWYVILDKQDGEKCLSSPVVFNKVAYYTTFAPTVPNLDDPCFVGEGTARVYPITHMLGNPVFNLDLTSEDLTKEDRSTVIGTAIPSGVIITIIGGKAVGYVGVGGGVYTPQLPSTRTFYPLHWKIVF